MGDIVIRDVSGPGTKEWVPPIGAMGGPAAHELYRDLVLRAGLRLFRDGRGNPYVALRDGEHDRNFRVPSRELREALDRFRMNRSLRPLPDQELAEFARVVQARVSDPDILVPTLDLGRSSPANGEKRAANPGADVPDGSDRPSRWDEAISSIAREERVISRPDVAPVPVAKVPSAWNDVVDTAPAPPRAPPPLRASIAGGRSLPPVNDDGLPRYVSTLRSLMERGNWVGTTAELSHLTGDTPEQVFARLRAYRADLANQDIVVVPVETKSGWRWLAVDGNHLSSSR